MSELNKLDMSESFSPSVEKTENYQEFDSQNEMSDQEADKLWEEQLGEGGELEEQMEKLPPSTYEERMNHVPSADSPRGEWSGERGESGFRPNDPEALKAMEDCSVKEIPYQDAKVDFSDVAVATVEIPNMGEQRLGAGGNYEQCDTALSNRWNSEAKDGKDDWRPRDVADYRHENNYTWHERNDMKTCDLVPTSIHDACRHLGGVSECKKANREG